MDRQYHTNLLHEPQLVQIRFLFLAGHFDFTCTNKRVQSPRENDKKRSPRPGSFRSAARVSTPRKPNQQRARRQTGQVKPHINLNNACTNNAQVKANRNRSLSLLLNSRCIRQGEHWQLRCLGAYGSTAGNFTTTLVCT